MLKSPWLKDLEFEEFFNNLDDYKNIDEDPFGFLIDDNDEDEYLRVSVGRS